MNSGATRRRASVMVALAAGLALVSAPAAHAAAPRADRVPASEKELMVSAIADHFGAVRMAQMCMVKATRMDLRSLCEEIEITQGRELEQLRSWLKAWFGTDEQPSVPAEVRQFLGQLEKLTGAQFEREIARFFVVHQKEILSAVDTCRKEAPHPALRQLCELIFRTLPEVIKQFEAIAAGRGIPVHAGEGGLAAGSGADDGGNGPLWVVALAAGGALLTTRRVLWPRRR